MVIEGQKEWYVVSTYSGHEKKFKANLETRIKTMSREGQNLEDLILRIVVAEKEVPATKKDENGNPVVQMTKDANGNEVEKKKVVNIYPGYVFVEVIMTDFVWYVIRNTPEATGFIGSSGKGAKPFPVPREEIEPILKRMSIVDEEMYERYKEGDYIKVISGPLEGTEGRITKLYQDTHVVEVETTFFGKTSKVEVNFSEIEKINN